MLEHAQHSPTSLPINNQLDWIYKALLMLVKQPRRRLNKPKNPRPYAGLSPLQSYRLWYSAPYSCSPNPSGLPQRIARIAGIAIAFHGRYLRESAYHSKGPNTTCKLCGLLRTSIRAKAHQEAAKGKEGEEGEEGQPVIIAKRGRHGLFVSQLPPQERRI